MKKPLTKSQIFAKNAHKRMKFFSEIQFRHEYKTLFSVIMQSMDEYAKEQNKELIEVRNGYYELWKN